MLQLEQPATLKLGHVGSIEGSISCDNDAKAVGNIRLRLMPNLRNYDPRRNAIVTYSAQDVTKEDGSFCFEDVPAGQYQVAAELPSASPHYCDGGETIEVKPGETAAASLQLKPATIVKGTIVDQKTGEGIAGVRVSIYFQDGQRIPGAASPAPSDAKGEFAIRTRPGKGFLQIYQVPDQYLAPSPRQPQTVEIKGDMTLDPIRLERANALEGIVVNKAGKPVANAEIRYTDTEMGLSLQDVLHSDAAGKFA